MTITLAAVYAIQIGFAGRLTGAALVSGVRIPHSRFQAGRGLISFRRCVAAHPLTGHVPPNLWNARATENKGSPAYITRMFDRLRREPYGNLFGT